VMVRWYLVALQMVIIIFCVSLTPCILMYYILA
ncbi:MAG: hypothetical protein ACI8R8_001662, partial [Paraglaciecola sp.]